MIWLLKFTLPAFLVALISLISRRWGLKVGGAMGGFPVVVGPVLFFFTLEQGPDFAAAAALRSLGSVLAFGLFCMALSWACLKLPLFLSLLLGWATFLGVSWLGLRYGSADLILTFLVAIACAAAARMFLPGDRRRGERAAKPHDWDIPLRMAVTVALVVTVTGLAHILGPEWSGVFAAFPVASSILSSFAYHTDGPYGPAVLLKGSLLGNFSYLTFCAVLAWALPKYGVSASFLSATFLAMVVQTGALSLPRKKE